MLGRLLSSYKRREQYIIVADYFNIICGERFKYIFNSGIIKVVLTTNNLLIAKNEQYKDFKEKGSLLLLLGLFSRILCYI